jgi:hypothetical protein
MSVLCESFHSLHADVCAAVWWSLFDVTIQLLVVGVCVGIVHVKFDFKVYTYIYIYIYIYRYIRMMSH